VEEGKKEGEGEEGSLDKKNRSEGGGRGVVLSQGIVCFLVPLYKGSGKSSATISTRP